MDSVTDTHVSQKLIQWGHLKTGTASTSSGSNQSVPAITKIFDMATSLTLVLIKDMSDKNH